MLLLWPLHQNAHEYFSDRVLLPMILTFDMPDGYTTDYQMDAVMKRDFRNFIRYDGFSCRCCWSWKTVVATMIAKSFLIEMVVTRQKSLWYILRRTKPEVNIQATYCKLCKLTLMEVYQKCLMKTTIIIGTLTSLTRCWWWSDKFRSHTTAAFEQLQEICKMPRTRMAIYPVIKKGHAYICNANEQHSCRYIHLRYNSSLTKQVVVQLMVFQI